jgi:SAM-dependent methyltransferase
MDEILSAKRQIEEACKGSKAVANESFVSLDIYQLENIIQHGERDGYMQQGQRVLDMGGGDGRSGIYLAHRGYNVVSIELQPGLVDIAREAAFKCKDLMPEGIGFKACQGDYRPEGHMRKRISGKSFAVKAENKISGSNNPADYLLFPKFTEDAYKKNNINIKDIDLFYAYAWQIQAPSILEIFKDYARDDATLCLVGPTSSKYVKQLGLIPCWNDETKLEPYWERFVRKIPLAKS